MAEAAARPVVQRAQTMPDPALRLQTAHVPPVADGPGVRYHPALTARRPLARDLQHDRIRNVLLHDHVQLDYQIVVDAVTQLEPVEEFFRIVAESERTTSD